MLVIQHSVEWGHRRGLFTLIQTHRCAVSCYLVVSGGVFCTCRGLLSRFQHEVHRSAFSWFHLLLVLAQNLEPGAASLHARSFAFRSVSPPHFDDSSPPQRTVLRWPLRCSHHARRAHVRFRQVQQVVGGEAVEGVVEQT